MIESVLHSFSFYIRNWYSCWKQNTTKDLFTRGAPKTVHLNIITAKFSYISFNDRHLKKQSKDNSTASRGLGRSLSFVVNRSCAVKKRLFMPEWLRVIQHCNLSTLGRRHHQRLMKIHLTVGWVSWLIIREDDSSHLVVSLWRTSSFFVIVILMAQVSRSYYFPIFSRFYSFPLSALFACVLFSCSLFCTFELSTFDLDLLILIMINFLNNICLIKAF